MEKELIKFEKTESSIPFIKVKHNNITFNLVVDTGCTISCIDENILDLLVHKTTNDYTQGLISAEGGNDNNVPIVEMPITIGDQDYIEKFNVVDFREMSQQVKENFGLTIRGLLGSEFLYKHSLILDFDKHLIRYTDGNQTSIDFRESESTKTAD